MLASTEDRPVPASFWKESKSFKDMLSINSWLQDLIEFLLQETSRTYGGRVLPCWTTSGVRYQYIPNRLASKIDIVGLFEILLDIRSEIMHETIQLSLSVLEQFEGYDVKFWGKFRTTHDGSIESKREKLQDAVRDVVNSLRDLVRLETDDAKSGNRLCSTLIRGLEVLRSFIARFEDLNSSISSPMPATEKDVKNDHDGVEAQSPRYSPSTDISQHGSPGGEDSSNESLPTDQEKEDRSADVLID